MFGTKPAYLCVQFGGWGTHRTGLVRLVKWIRMAQGGGGCPDIEAVGCGVCEYGNTSAG